MSVKRTPEQIAADNTVEEALAKLAAAYRRELGATLLNWVIVTHGACFDEDAELSTEVTEVYQSPNCMMPTALGMLTLARSAIFDDEDES